MPNYYNPNLFYPATYQPMVGNASFAPYAQPQMPQQSYAAPQQQAMKAMEWVEGEVGAKAFQMPQGWPANQPIPLWDSTDTVIWLKSWSPMGFPNPIQKLHYTMPEQQSQMALPQGTSSEGNSGNMSGAASQDMSQYVTKDDLNQMRQEIRNLMNQNQQNGNSGANASGNQNGSNSGQNRGGNR